MATKNLLTLSRHRRPLLLLLLPSCSLSTSISPATISSDEISPAQSPPFLLYDQISAAVNSKLRRLENPDPRFLRRASPHLAVADHSPILSSPETRTTTLDNGLRVATESALAARYAAIAVSVETGSRFDPEDAAGAAAFLQRVISNGKIATEVDKLGGFSTGSTTREKTTFLVRVAAKDVPKALEILSAGLQSPNLDDSGLGAERIALLRERDKVEPQQEEVIFDHLHATAFQYTPLGRTILGPAQNISTITKEHLKNFMSTHYTSPRIVISASGAVKHEDVVNQVKKLFTSLPTDPSTSSQLVAKEPATFTGSEVRIIDDDLPLAQFAVAFSGASWTDPDSLALMVIQTMLGSVNKDSGDGKHMGSELAQMVAINQIAESMKAFSFNYKDTGLFGVYAIAEPDCLDDLAYAIMYAVSKLSYRVSEADVTRACNQLKSSLLRIHGSNAVAEDIGCQMLTYRRKIPAAELFARIDAVDASTIKRVANRFIFDQDVAIAAMGPIKKLPDYNWFRRRTYLNRY